MQMKKILIMCLCLALMLPVTFVYASSDMELLENDLIQPMFTNINVFYNDFQITDRGKALLTSSVDARNVDKITISTYLQKYQNGSWTTVKHWTTTQSGSLAVLGESWYVASGYQYRMVSYGYVYNDGQLLESATYISDTEFYE
ncbi:MAG: hypothetical protein PHT78_07505 [Desulfitobacteriaceae bacterium]|nr:hypothetical protein [Desulfitobacteriaceae bacterium]